MRKSEKFAVLDTIREMEPEAVRETLEELDRWSENHYEIGNSPFWKPHRNGAWIKREVTIGDFKIIYFPVCMHIGIFYYDNKDYLVIAGKGMEDAKITFEDISLFRYAMQERINHGFREPAWKKMHSGT